MAFCAAAACALAAAAGVDWRQTTYDYGAFTEDGGSVSCEFLFVNNGPEPVSIVAARASCGCTTPSFTKTPVAVGDTGRVEVRYNPVGRPGRFSKTVTVSLSDAAKQTLTVKGVVIGAQNTLKSRYPVDAGPLKLRGVSMLMGTVRNPGAKSATFEVYNATTSPITPSWSGLPKYLKVKAMPETIPPGEQGVYSFVLTAGPDVPYGFLCDSLRLEIPGGEPVKVEYTAIVEEDFRRLTPGQRQKAPKVSVGVRTVDFGRFDPSAGPVEREFEVANLGKSDLLVRRVYTLDPSLTIVSAPSKVKKGKRATVRVRLDPSKVEGKLLNGRIQLIVNDPDEPMTTLRAVGEPK